MKVHYLENLMLSQDHSIPAMLRPIRNDILKQSVSFTHIYPWYMVRAKEDGIYVVSLTQIRKT
jgi:hypothetical protein